MTKRPRRARATRALRDLTAETDVLPRHLALPHFVRPGRGIEEAVASLPGVSRVSVDMLLPRLERQLRAGVRTALLFGVPDDADKDGGARSADDAAGPVPSALRAAREAFGDDLVLVTDVCLCAHTDHGHCGVLVRPRAHGSELVVDNDRSLERLAAMAAAHAEAGADLVSPSDMMDGRVATIRARLDAAGFSSVGILSYAVKYASAFYGPFRDAAGSAPGGAAAAPDGPAAPTTRETYQMDPRNAREALREAALDEAEGADMLMVKPALAYLDVLARLRPTTTLPLVAYQVSGEYAMLKAAAAAGVLDEASAMRETITAIRRAGADLIVTYAAVEALERGWLR
ncbi:MAG: porphobilinogen synthase [Trueperaceae bacterium]|nr:MAG: porphobilinogen synthase [Trueperaceae bacterium]